MLRSWTWALTFLLSFLLTGLLSLSSAEAGDAAYELRFPRAKNHYVEVKASLPTHGQSQMDLMMAVWTPGSYKVREYARHVESLRELSGAVIRKTAKNRWRVACQGLKTVELSYRVYGREMSVRTNWIESDFAMLNGAPTFIVDSHHLDQAMTIKVKAPKAWKSVISALPSVSQSGQTWVFRAKDYDHLVDCPTVAGKPDVYDFEVGGVDHKLVNIGSFGYWDGGKATKDLRRIVAEHQRMWGDVPYKRYVFFNMLTETGGGLEHKNSTILMSSRWRFRVKKSYQSWLNLASHEFFHTWNIKRLRPVTLGPFNYEQENYTRSLWVVEGITSYYTPLAVVRAKVMNEKDYLAGLSRGIKRVRSIPGRKVQSLDESSFDAWIKHYMPDENSVNTMISYYTKGALVGWLLDMRIRELSQGQKSLDDVMRLAYQRFSGTQGYTPEQFEKIPEELTGESFKDWFDTHVRGRGDLNYKPALKYLGLKFKKTQTRENKAWLGLSLKDQNSRLIVSSVVRGTPAYEMGFNADDEVLALNGFRVLPGQWKERLKQYRPGERAKVTIARRGHVRVLKGRFEKQRVEHWTLVPDPKAKRAAHKRRRNWLRLRTAKLY